MCVFRAGPRDGRFAGVRFGQQLVELAAQVQAHDRTFESHGVPIVVDDQSLKYLDGSEVDYARDGLNEGFRFVNPNVTATCGCGESFSL